MERRKLNISVFSVLKVFHIKVDENDLPKQIYICLLLAVCFITFLSATISWIQLPNFFFRVIIQYAFSGICVVLIYVSQTRKEFLVFGFNLLTIGLLAYLYFPSGGSLGAVPLFILANTLFSWILLFGGNSRKLIASMSLHASLFIIIPLIDIQNPGLVAHRYLDRTSQIQNLMTWGSVCIVFIILFMWMWSRLLQVKFTSLMEQIEIDDLTGAYTKAFIIKLIENFRTTSDLFHRRHSVVFVDMDNFKQINDCHGHLAGDEVLREFGRYCQKALRNTDYFSRFGGDEFLVFLPNTNVEEAFSIMERLRQDVSNLKWSSASIHITISVGVGELVVNKNVEVTLGLIDKKMYESKKSGKNRVISIQ